MAIHCTRLRLQPSRLCPATGSRWSRAREWGRRTAQLFLT